MPVFEEFTGDEGSELTNGISWFADTEDVDIRIVREDDEVIGGSAVFLDDDYLVLRYLEIDHDYRGMTIQGQSLAGALTEYTFDSIPEDRTVYAQGTNLDGKTQHLLQDNGFEFSGLAFDKDKGSGGGFNADLWRLGENEKIEAYVPDELRSFVDTSLSGQREVVYREPDSSLPATGSMEIENNNSKRVKSDITGGETIQYHINHALALLGSSDDWAEIVDIDVTEPVAYQLSEKLMDRGYSPVNMSPEVAGNRLRMARLHDELGEYDFTSESLELIEQTGLDYRVLEEDQLSSTLVFQS